MQCENQPECHFEQEAQKLRSVLDMVPALVSYVDRDGFYRLNNRIYEAWFGRRRGDVAGHHVREILGEEVWAKIEPRLRRALQGEVIHYDEWMPHQHGGARWLSVDYTPDFGADGGVQGVVVVARDLTEQRRRDEALCWHAQMLKVAQDAICIWRVPGGIEFWNDGATELYGYTAAEALGRDINQLLETQFPEPWNGIEIALRSHHRWEGVLRHRTKGGRDVIVHSRIQRIPNGDKAMVLLESGRDITEKTRAEAAQKREHAFNETLLKTTAALIVALDRHGRIAHFNPAFENVSGYTFAEVAGRTFFDVFLVPEEKDSVSAVFEALRKGQLPSTHVNYIRTRSGGRRLVEWSNNVLFDQRGTVDLIIGTGLDITGRRAMEREILQIGDRERQRIGQDLHDGLGQELTAIDYFNHGFLQQLRKQAPALAEEFERIAGHLRDTIRNARMLSHGLLPVRPEPEGLMLALQNLARLTAASRTIQCEFRCDEEVGVTDPLVATHLYRIAQEAVSNAVKHAHATRIGITLGRVGSVVELGIGDDGTGFSAMTSWDEGLGLRTMNYRAELIGARLQVASTEGRGVHITCTWQQPN